jgi:hypothetical protein
VSWEIHTGDCIEEPFIGAVYVSTRPGRETWRWKIVGRRFPLIPSPKGEDWELARIGGNRTQNIQCTTAELTDPKKWRQEEGR